MNDEELRVVLILTAVLVTGQSVFAQKHEIAFTSGGLKIGERGFDLPQPGFLRFGTGFTYEVGLAHFREGDSTVANQPNLNRDTETDAVFAFGFGLDVKVVSRLRIRGEVRDFYSDLPPLSVRALSDRQHNALISAGVVLRF